MAVVPTTQSTGKRVSVHERTGLARRGHARRSRSWMLVVLLLTASFFWLVTALGDAAPSAEAGGGAECDTSQLEQSSATPAFDLNPFFDEVDDAYDCRLSTPAPKGVTQCSVRQDEFAENHPYEVRYINASDGAEYATCFNIVSRMLPDKATCSVDQWVVGTIVNPPGAYDEEAFSAEFHIVVGGERLATETMTSPSGIPGSSEYNDFDYSEDVVVQFWGFLADVTTLPATVEVSFFDRPDTQTVATFDMAPPFATGDTPCVPETNG